MFGNPALRKLARLKFRGAIRRHFRRLKTLKGAVLTGLGLLLVGLWVVGVAISSFVGDRGPVEFENLDVKIGLAALALTVLSLSSAIAHRGLFLPREEIERLFSAPVRRSDLIRYRLLANCGRSAFGGLFIGLVAMKRMPLPAGAFVGVLLGMQTLPIVHQLIAILLGRLERGVARRLRTIGTTLFYVVLAGFGLLVFLLVTGTSPAELPLVDNVARALGEAARGNPLEHPLVVAITLPFRPWAHMIGAATYGEFAQWFGICLALFVVLVEVTARLPVDFRELSLETAASVAARIRRVRRGGGAAAAAISKRTAGWPIPWVFGRGPAGAIAWRKTGAIMRKARGTLLVSILVLCFVTLMSSYVVDRDQPTFVGPLFVAALGTLYLCAGLRFDFRDELDRMDVVKAWPVGPGRLFFAMLLPETCLVSVLLIAAVALRASFEDTLHPVTIGIVALLPLLVFGWVALDNAVFLFAPVRFVPGQEGALQNAGRGVILMLLRAVLVAVGATLAALAWMLARYLAENLLGWSETATMVLVGLAIWFAVFAVDGLLIWTGGWLFRRFDVARDRG